MYRKLSLIFGIPLAFAVLGGVFLWLGSDREIKNVPITQSGPVLIFGDSLAEGVGATTDHDLASLFQAALGEPVLNFGVAGETTRSGLRRLALAREERPRLAILILGGNDFLQKIPREETFGNLERIITAFHEDGAAVLVVGVRSGVLGGGADEEFEALANKTGAAYEEDILRGVFGNPDLMSDAIHPNNAGYEKIAGRLLPTVRTLLGK
jgi:acyl-CoA thioesterase I